MERVQNQKKKIEKKFTGKFIDLVSSNGRIKITIPPSPYSCQFVRSLPNWVPLDYKVPWYLIPYIPFCFNIQFNSNL